MTTYVIINTVFLLITMLLVGWLIYSLILNAKKNNTNIASLDKDIKGKSNLDWKAKISLIGAFLLVVISFAAPFILTRKSINEDFDFRATGQIGDTVGGLMNPFIALAGVIITGLAFYIQYKANQQQRELFEEEQKANKDDLQRQIDSQNKQNQLQQFESQFYEMIKLHRENVTEMHIHGYDFQDTSGSLMKMEKITEGRKVFVTMKTELECILTLYKSLFGDLNAEGYNKSYLLFFSGLDEFKKKYPSDTTFIELLEKARRRHSNPDTKAIKTNKERKEFSSSCKLNFNYKPFSGHASRLGHYFRHLYLIVKSVVKSEIITDYDNKMKYLRLLRAQLSNHEQILLFYNWLSGYGEDWENEENRFLTEYCMIHNLWYDNLIDDTFISHKVKQLSTKETKLRVGKMFEIDR